MIPEIIERLEGIRREAKSPVLARTATLIYRRGIDALIADLKAMEPERECLSCKAVHKFHGRKEGLMTPDEALASMKADLEALAANRDAVEVQL